MFVVPSARIPIDCFTVDDMAPLIQLRLTASLIIVIVCETDASYALSSYFLPPVNVSQIN